MRSVFVVLSLAGAAALSTGCGKEIGDECQLSIDCDPNGDVTYVCDLQSTDGYCTIKGCDYGTCPDEATCVSFFIASFENRPCDPNLAASQCGTDDICTLTGQCVPRGSEVRYCMKKCDEGDDCRSGYECRTQELMKIHGGQPVPAPGGALNSNTQSFCAEAPRS